MTLIIFDNFLEIGREGKSGKGETSESFSLPPAALFPNGKRALSFQKRR